MLKKLMLALTAAILIFSFTACKNNEEKPVNPDVNVPPVSGDEVDTPVVPDPGTDEDDLNYTADLSTDRYDGYNFRILVRKDKLVDQYFEEPPEDVVEAAIYNRNKTVEDMYGITITATESSSSDYETDAITSILAGDDAYDLVFSHSRASFAYAVQDAALNLNEISTLHLDKPWWSKDVVDSCNVNGHLYVTDGDISLHRLQFAICLLFNKRIFDDLGFDYPYELVEDGDWTFDEFSYYVKKGAKDLSGDGVIDPNVDQVGLFYNPYQLGASILYTGGQRVYDKDDEGIPELTLYSKKTVEIFSKFFSLVDSEAAVSTRSGKLTTNPFEAGRAMFYDGHLGNAKDLRKMDDDFGIIPLPKFDEDDEYATIVNGHAHLMLIPATVSDPERTGAIIEALCAIGSRDVIPAFYDVALKSKYARDDESEAMIDTIKESIVYDLGYFTDGQLGSVGQELSTDGNHDFASYYAERESASEQELREFVRDYADLEI